MFDTNYHGWDFAKEKQHFEALIEESRKAAGKEWYRDWNTVGDDIYALADKVQKEFPHITSQPLTEYDFSKYVQNSSSACAALNGGNRAIMAAQIFLNRKGKKVRSGLRYHAPEWIYAVYHALIDGDYSYGGCTLSGIMQAVNKHGSVTSRPEISDRELVQLGWNKRSKFQSVYEQYAPEAERTQIVTTVPQSFDNLRAALRAGFAVPYGTNIAVKLNSSGEYVEAGSTAHSMLYAGFKVDTSGQEWIGHINDYGDGFGWMKTALVQKQMKQRYWDGYVILDIENEV